MARFVLVLLTFLVLATLTPGQAAAHHHATQPAAAPVVLATDGGGAATHPCGHPSETPAQSKTCACPALCVPLNDLARALPPAPAPRRLAPLATLERDGIDRLPPVPPPRG